MSPAMHNAAFDAKGLNWRYVPLPVPPDKLPAALRGLVALGFRGANVTVPHKEAVLPALAPVALDAQTLGAANTLVVERSSNGSDRLSGHNTDVAGFIGALLEARFDPEGRSAVVIGAGGGARAVAFGLMQARAARIVVLNRTPERSKALISDLVRGAPSLVESPTPSILEALPLTPETLAESARAVDLLVNATSVGMWPCVEDSVWPEDAPIPSRLTVFDLVYNPLETRLLQQARASGARALGGLEMLVQQGALSFEMWTGVKAPIDVMRDACARALRP